MRRKVVMLVALPLLAILVFASCAGEQLPVVGEAPGFTLTNQDGQDVSLSDLRGKVVLLDFIYTRCPDVCPTLNQVMRNAYTRNGSPEDLALVSISFDWEFDTPERLKEYAVSHGFNLPGWQLLTGTQEQIQAVADDYGVEVTPQKPEIGERDEGSHNSEHQDLFSHGILIVLIDQDGMIRKQYVDPVTATTELVDDVKSLL